MSPEAMTNALLILLITLVGSVAAVGLHEFRKFAADIKQLIISDIKNTSKIEMLDHRFDAMHCDISENKKNIIAIQEEMDEHFGIIINLKNRER